MRRMVFPYLLPLTSHSLLLTLFMLQTVIQNIIRFVVLVLVQVLVLNHVQFLGFVNPYVYVLFILSLPVRTPRWLTLVLSFGLGMAVDAFADTLGLHAFACVLAGFLRMVSEPILKAFPGRIVNIHPSLLPKYGGKGMYGDRVHEAVKRAGDRESGITIHHVNERYDEGASIFQATCPVEPADTPADVARKVHAWEYAHYPRVIESLLS